MVVFTADLICTPLLEPKRDPVLVVDPYAVSAGAITLQRFQPIPGWHPQGVNPARRVYPVQFSPSPWPQELRECTARRLAVGADVDVVRSFVAKRLNHASPR